MAATDHRITGQITGQLTGLSDENRITGSPDKSPYVIGDLVRCSRPVNGEAVRPNGEEQSCPVKPSSDGHPQPQPKCPICHGTEFIEIAPALHRCANAVCRWLVKLENGRTIDAVNWTTAGSRSQSRRQAARRRTAR